LPTQRAAEKLISGSELIVHCYRAFGLTIASEFVCPELILSRGTPEVTIRYGDVPAILDDATAGGVLYQITPDRFLLDLKPIAGIRYLVQHGSEMIVECSLAAPPIIRLFLFGSCMGALLYQRGALPLHGSAIQTPRGAVVFAGLSGSGKSTIAAGFHARGFAVLADDISVITLDETGTPAVFPGPQRLNLWPDILQKLGKDQQSTRRIRPVMEKYDVSLGVDFAEKSLPLHAVYILQPNNVYTVHLEPVRGVERLRMLHANWYRHRYSKQMGKVELLVRQSAAIASQVKICRILRPDGPVLLDELLEHVEKDFAK
jgi:hypothetical protein